MPVGGTITIGEIVINDPAAGNRSEVRLSLQLELLQN
jgi:hypothetical protein